MDGDESHAVVRRLEVEHAEVGDHPADLVETGRRRPGRRRPGVADTGDEVDLIDEGAWRVVGHPVAGRVVDGVAGGATHPDELHLWVAPSRRWR